MKNSILVVLALGNALTAFVDSTPFARHARAVAPNATPPTLEPAPLANSKAFDTNEPAHPTQEVDSKDEPEDNNPALKTLPNGTYALLMKYQNSSNGLSPQTLFVLNSITAGFNSDKDDIIGREGYELSGFGGMMSGLIGLDESNGAKVATAKSPSSAVLGGFSLQDMMKMFGVGPSEGKDGSDPKPSGVNFIPLLGALGVKPDANAPGGSAPGGGSYDMTNVMKNMGMGKSGGSSSSLGMLMGGLFNARKETAGGGVGGTSGGANGGLASMIAGLLGGR